MSRFEDCFVQLVNGYFYVDVDELAENFTRLDEQDLEWMLSELRDKNQDINRAYARECL